VPAGPDDTGTQPVFKGKPGGGSIVVSSVDPPEAEQGITLDVAVRGRNFPRGDVDSCTDPSQDCTWAEFGIAEVVTAKVKTNRSTWVSSKKLIANITIDAEAVPDLYDAIVSLSLRGSRGVGTESFEVKVSSSQGTDNLPVRLEFVPAPDAAFVSDGVSDDGAYVHGDRDLEAYVTFVGGGGADWARGRLLTYAQQSPRTFPFQMTIVGGPSQDYPLLPTGCGEGQLACAGEAETIQTKFVVKGFEDRTLLDLTPDNPTGYTQLRAGWSEVLEGDRLHWWIVFGDFVLKGKPGSGCAGSDRHVENRVLATATTFDKNDSPTAWTVKSAVGDARGNAVLCETDEWVADLYGDLEMEVCLLDTSGCSATP
jgi:hypothetical protein